MRNKVRLVAGIAAALAIAVFATSCDDSTGPNAGLYSATLLAANELPPTAATGSGIATFFDRGTHIEWAIEVTNLTGITDSHIHLGSATQNGGIIINLFTPRVATGTVTGLLGTGTITAASNATVSLDSLRVLFNNANSYVNIHTTANPGGAVRGQVVPD
jgi:hypothetical protein